MISGFTKFSHVLLIPDIASDFIRNYYSLDHNIIDSFATQDTWEICLLQCDLGNHPELANMKTVCLSSLITVCRGLTVTRIELLARHYPYPNMRDSAK